MKRRAFIALVGGAAAWPATAQAQQGTPPVVGYLNPGPADTYRFEAVAFLQGLSDSSYVEGRNVAIEYRWANGQYDQLPKLATDLVRQKVAVIAVVTPVSALAAKRATSSIPIVFAVGSDPVKDGIVESLNRPGGNITGAAFFANLLDAKRMGLLHELVPSVHVVAALINPKNANFEREKHAIQESANALGLDLLVLPASTEREIDDSLVTLVEKRAGALFVVGDAFLNSHADHIATLAINHSIPTSFALREQAAAGGLMSYGASISSAMRQAGTYVGRILRGEKPVDLPVQQPTKFEFALNMKTAKALGLKVPESMQLLADEMIE